MLDRGVLSEPVLDIKEGGISSGFESFMDFFKAWRVFLVDSINCLHPVVNFSFKHGTNAAELVSLFLNPSVD